MSAETMRDVTLHRNLVPVELVTDLRRRLLLEIRRVGLSVYDMATWERHGWWPSLRGEPEVVAIMQFLESCGFIRLGSEVWAEPQILLRFPDEDAEELGRPHLDDPPEWAVISGLVYKAIYGVELTPLRAMGDGNTVVWDGVGETERQRFVGPMSPGDVCEMRPDVWHSGSPNYGAAIRMALFLRVLGPAR